MSRSLNLHSNFFSSLKQVEKRLKLEHDSSDPQIEIDSNATESLSSPLYLHRHTNTTQCSNLEDSEIPFEFLSNSSDFPSTHEEQPLPEETLLNPPQNIEENDVDDIGLLIELLGLSDFEGDESKLELESCCSCHCGSGFFGKIAGVKGPKCKKEMERLDGWITYFRNQKIESFRLAHLLLGKAVFLDGNCCDGRGFEELEFPSTIEEFLRRDPPIA